ncbi:Protein CBG25088, partial [Caenorhabditis briggsae]
KWIQWYLLRMLLQLKMGQRTVDILHQKGISIRILSKKNTSKIESIRYEYNVGYFDKQVQLMNWIIQMFRFSGEKIVVAIQRNSKERFLFRNRLRVTLWKRNAGGRRDYVPIHDASIPYPAHWPTDLIHFINAMLKFDKEKRLVGLEAIKKHAYTERIDFKSVFERKPAPVFIPCKEGLNCDPMYELEERILVSTPIHRRRTNHNNSSGRSSSEPQNAALVEVSKAFIDFSRHNMKIEPNGVCRSN